MKRAVAAVAVVVYLIAVGLLASFERSMLFPAPTLPEGWLAAAARDQGAEELSLRAEDGTALYGWHVRAPESRGVVVWFEGNGGSVGMRGDEFARLAADGWDVVQVNYRGYPGSAGEPSEEGLRKDARAAWTYATQFGRPWIYGKSLGGAVAIGLAAEVDARALIVESTFESAVRVGTELMPWVPVRVFMKNRLDSAALAPRVRAPTLLLHGEADEMISVRHAHDLVGAFPNARLVTFPGGMHNDTFLTTERGWAATRELLGVPPAAPR
jgi:uncharacterized protein